MSRLLRMLRRIGFFERRWIPDSTARDAHEHRVRLRLRMLARRR